MMERGLFLFVPSAGARLWRMRYRIGGREKMLAPGEWPHTSIAIRALMPRADRSSRPQLRIVSFASAVQLCKVSFGPTIKNRQRIT